jgi:hypothetical protein
LISIEIFDQNTTPSWLTPAKRFPISPEIKTKDSFHLWSTQRSIPKGKSDFHWNSFMGIEVPVHTGPEMLAKDMT